MLGPPRHSLLAASLGLAACTTILGADGVYTGEGGGDPTSTTSTGATTGSTGGDGAGGHGTGGDGAGGHGSGAGGGAGGGAGAGCPPDAACLTPFRGVPGGDVRLATSPWAQSRRAAMLVRDDAASFYALDPGGWNADVAWGKGPGWLATPFARDGSEGFATWVDPNEVHFFDEGGPVAGASVLANVDLPFAVQGSPSGFFVLARPSGTSIPIVHHLTSSGTTQGPNTCDVSSNPLVALDLASFGSQWISLVRCEKYVDGQHGNLLGGGTGNFLVSTDPDITGLGVAANAEGGAAVLGRVGTFEVVAIDTATWTVTLGAARVVGTTPSVAVRGQRIHVAYEDEGQILLARCDRGAEEVTCATLPIAPAPIFGARPRLAFDGTLFRLAWVQGEQVFRADVTLGVN